MSGPVLSVLCFQKDLEVKKKAVPLQSQNKKKGTRVLIKTGAEKIKIEKFLKKDLEIKK